MPIHLYWGDDEAARQRAVEDLVERLVDPAWSALNLSRLDGNDAGEAGRALEEARTPPFAGGARVVLLQRSPFTGSCNAELAARFEACLALIPESCHLVLVCAGKPDARLRTTKALRKLAEAVGNDSARLAAELEKLSLFAAGGAGPDAATAPITATAVAALVQGHASSSLAVGEALLAGRPAEAIALVDGLLIAGEPALRIVASLTSQIRGWLWVTLLDASGEQDVAVIAKAAGIGNPKRIYVMRKQIRGRTAGQLLALLSRLLEVEAALKRGREPGDAFRDGFLLSGPQRTGSADPAPR